MSRITNYHVPDQTNIGDLLSSPIQYFEFPGYSCQVKDILEVNSENIEDSHIIIGGGGLLFQRFLPHIQDISKYKTKKLIFWGVGQQAYGKDAIKPEVFDYASFFTNSDLIGIRDDAMKHTWVPCPSCMHPAFDKERKPQHDIVVFSHKKFQIDFPHLPRMTNLTNDFDTVLDFLGSGKIILTSSFHGAYWGTLLGRKVIAFPFSSKFYTLRHQPTLYPLKKWSRIQWKLSILGRTLISREHAGDKLTCDMENWQDYLEEAPIYPDSLEICRERNIWFYQQVMEFLQA